MVIILRTLNYNKLKYLPQRVGITHFKVCPSQHCDVQWKLVKRYNVIGQKKEPVTKLPHFTYICPQKKVMDLFQTPKSYSEERRLPFDLIKTATL